MSLNLRGYMIDESSNNGPTDLDELWRLGERIITFKTSQGISYAWGGAKALSDHWHRLGGIVDHYHFLEPGSAASGTAQADYFYNHVRDQLGPHDRPILDAETKGENGSETNAFIDRCHDHMPYRRGLIYGGPYFLRDNHIGPHRGWGLWLAEYASRPDFIPPGWTTWTAWQFSQTAHLPGVTGAVDESYIRRSMLEPTLRYGERSFAVLDAKRLLKAAGYGAGIVLDMNYGWGTRRQVARFKAAHPHIWTPRQAVGTVIGGVAWQQLHKAAGR